MKIISTFLDRLAYDRASELIQEIDSKLGELQHLESDRERLSLLEAKLEQELVSIEREWEKLGDYRERRRELHLATRKEFVTFSLSGLPDEIRSLIEPDPSETFYDNALDETVELVCRVLSDRQREVINMRFGFNGSEPMTLQEIADYFQVSRDRIRQIENHALHKLRQPQYSRRLLEFL